jgi:hypothetical protein
VNCNKQNPGCYAVKQEYDLSKNFLYRFHCIAPNSNPRERRVKYVITYW